MLASFTLMLDPLPSFASGCGTCSECATPRTEDTLVCGCFNNGSGEVGFGQSINGESILGDIGEVVTVSVFIHTIGSVAAWGLDVAYPTNVLQYQSAARGNLTATFGIFGANLLPSGVVRIGAFAGQIPAGSSGALATISFTIIGAGCAPLCVDGLFDDISVANGYSACLNPGGGVSAGDAMQRGSWGYVKALYE
jgi:hypothetical protein